MTRTTFRTRIAPAFLRHAYPRSTSSAAHYVGIGKQITPGTGVAPTVAIPYQSAVDLSHGMEGDDVRQAGTGPYVNRTTKTAHDPAGGFGFAVRPRTFAQMSAWFLGADAVVAAAGLHDHTATPAETLTLLSVEHAAGVSGDIVERMVDSVLNKCTITCAGNGDLMAAYTYEALTAAWQTGVATPTIETGISGSTPGGPFRAAEATYTVDGAAASTIESMSIELEWRLDDVRLSRVTRNVFLKLELVGKVKVRQLLDDAARNEYRKINYGATDGTAPSRNFFQGGSLVAAFGNGLTLTNLRQTSITIPAIDWKAIPYTALDPAGSTMYVEREGTITKGSNPFVTIVSRTADAAAY